MEQVLQLVRVMQMTIQTLKQIELQIQQFQFDASSLKLRQLEPILQNEIEKRFLGHLYAKMNFLKGDYNLAYSQLRELQDKYSPYIGIQADLVFSLMLMGDYSSAEHFLLLAESEFKIAKSFLNSEAHIRTLIFFGKIFYQYCYFHESLLYFEQAQLIDSVPRKWVHLAKISIFRVKTFLGMDFEQIQKMYWEIFKIHFEEPKFENEKNHALWHAGNFLSGSAANKLAEFQYFEPAKKSKDFMLISAAIIEHYILTKNWNELDSQLISDFLDGVARDGFEKVLQMILLKTQTFRLDNISVKMGYYYLQKENPLGKLRILFLLLQLTDDISMQNELKNTIRILVQSFTPENQLIIGKKWNLEWIQNQKLSLTYFENKGLQIDQNKKYLKIPEKSIVHIIFQQLASSGPSLSTDVIINKLWDTELTFKKLDALKLHIYRINKKLKSELKVETVLFFTKSHITLNQRFILQLSKTKLET